MNPDTLSGIVWRVEQVERRLERVEQHKTSVEDVAQLRKSLEEDVGRLREEVRSLRNMLLAFTGSVLSGALLFAFTMVALFGGRG